MLIRYNKFVNFKNVCIFIEAMVCAYYLMRFVNQVTLSTSLQKMFVTSYFFLMLIIVFKIFNTRLIRRVEGNKKKILVCISILITLVVMLLSKNIIVPKAFDKNSIRIVSLNSKDENSQGYETWLSMVKIGNKEVELSDAISNAYLWEYKDNALYSNGQFDKNMLLIEGGKGQDITLSFQNHAWSGTVLIEANQEYKNYNLYNPEGDTLEINIPSYSLELGVGHIIILLAGAFIILFKIIMFLLILLLFIKR